MEKVLICYTIKLRGEFDMFLLILLGAAFMGSFLYTLHEIVNKKTNGFSIFFTSLLFGVMFMIVVASLNE